MSKDFYSTAISDSHVSLVRLCRFLTGDAEAAEDLAQETLLEAWRGRERLQDPDAVQAWLAGIARNVCRRYFQRATLERRSDLRQGPEDASGDDAWEDLERTERAALLDRAMGLLPASARSILVARYEEEQSLAEIAMRTGCSENTAAVRLGRARETLGVVLKTRLRVEASEYGLIERQADYWLPTRVWCFRCGRRRLEERRDCGGGLGVRCPRCDGEGSDIAFSTRHAAMDTAQVLGSVHSCKPALRRINAWWDERLRRGLITGILPCWRCAGMMARQPRLGSSGDVAGFQYRASFHCSGCGAAFSLPASGLAFHSLAVQQFWQRHPRLRVRQERLTQIGRRPALVTSYEAIGSTATIEVIYDAVTFQPWNTPGELL